MTVDPIDARRDTGKIHLRVVLPAGRRSDGEQVLPAFRLTEQLELSAEFREQRDEVLLVLGAESARSTATAGILPVHVDAVEHSSRTDAWRHVALDEPVDAARDERLAIRRQFMCGAL